MHERLGGPMRYVVLTLAIVIVGWLGAQTAETAVSPTGTIGPTVLQSQSPVAAMIWTICFLAVATAIGAGVGWLTNAAVGMFVLGCGLYALAFRSGTVEALAFSEEGSMALVALETAIWGAFLALAAIAVFRIAGPLRDMQPEDVHESESMFSTPSLSSAAIGAITLIGVLLIARTHGKGQTIMAALIGAMGAGMVARVLRPHVQPILLFATPCLFGAIGHLIGMQLIADPLDDAFVKRVLWPLSLPMPADYAAGAAMGVSVGLGWARSFLHPEHESMQPAARPT